MVLEFVDGKPMVPTIAGTPGPQTNTLPLHATIIEIPNGRLAEAGGDRSIGRSIEAATREALAAAWEARNNEEDSGIWRIHWSSSFGSRATRFNDAWPGFPRRMAAFAPSDE